MANKRISALNTNTSPTLNDLIPIVNSGVTKNISVTGLANFMKPVINVTVTGGTYDNTNGTATFTNNTGGTFVVSGFSTSMRFWVENDNVLLQPTETLVISGDYVLDNTNLFLTSGGTKFIIGDITFDKCSQVYIGGNMLLRNSNIINDGILGIGGSVIMSGSSTITGNGILI